MSRLKDMTGMRLEMCTVLNRAGTSPDRKAMWECLCDCGNIFVTLGKSLRSGATKSCGCHRKNILKTQGKRNITHGETKTRLYNIWHGMRKRCSTLSDTSYKHYGKKGITVCEDWLNSYELFRDWALEHGYNDELTIDRIDNSKGYSPNNCRWVTMKVQQNNRTNNVIVEFNGKEMTLSQVADAVGESTELIWYRHKNGIKYDAKKRNA